MAQKGAPYRIKEVWIRNFCSLENVRLSLDDLTVLLGRNGAGKTTIMRAFEFLQNMAVATTRFVELAALDAGGVDGIRPKRLDKKLNVIVGLGVKFDGGEREAYWTVRLNVRRDGGISVMTEEIGARLKKRDDDQGPYRGALRWAPPQVVDRPRLPTDADEAAENELREAYKLLRNVFPYRVVPEVMRDVEGKTSGALLSSGRNIADVLLNIQQKDRKSWEWISRFLKKVVPEIVEIGVEEGMGGRRVFARQRVGTKEQIIYAPFLSEGALRYLGILAALRQRPRPSLAFFDEIDNSLDLSVLASLFEAIKEMSAEYPIVFTTHNPNILDIAGVAGRNIRFLTWKNGVSNVFRPTEEIETMTNEFRDFTLSKLWRANSMYIRDAPETVPEDIFPLKSPE